MTKQAVIEEGYRAIINDNTFEDFGVFAGAEGILTVHPLADKKLNVPEHLRRDTADYVFIPDMILGRENINKTMLPVRKLKEFGI